MRAARAKILEKAQRKYLFEFEPQRVPTGLIVEDGRMVGVQMSRTEVADGQVRTLRDSASPVRAPLTISSIGSIPEQIPGIPVKGEVYAYIDSSVGLLDEGPTAVYAAGNVLTGKGNIKDSLESGTFVGVHVAEAYLGLDGDDISLGEGARKEAEQQATRIADAMKSRPGLGPDQVADVMRRVRERQRAVGYEGNYRAWITRVTPADLH
jgi:hypothetical protein